MYCGTVVKALVDTGEENVKRLRVQILSNLVQMTLKPCTQPRPEGTR